MSTPECNRKLINILANCGLGNAPQDLAMCARAWDLVFAKHSDDEIAVGVTSYMESGGNFWPVPAAIRKLIPGVAAAAIEATTDHADAMWGLVRNWVRRGGDCRPDRNGILQRDQEPDWLNLRRKGDDCEAVNPEAIAAGVNACGWMTLAMQDDSQSRTNRNVFLGVYRAAVEKAKAGDLQLSSADAKDVLGMIQRKRLTDCDDD